MPGRSLLEQYYHEKFILEVAIATLERGGVTSNAHTYQFLELTDAWGLPRYPERTRILPPEGDLFSGLRDFIHRNRDVLHAPGSWLGTWVNPLTCCCHLDITELYPTLEEARARALQRNAITPSAIIALYDFQQQRAIYLNEETEPLRCEK